MNTITLNGVRSDTIQGLLIQSLPPISKPPIRVNVEEIDGRNGDIITDLGYQAYDKTITIGLRGSFDINQVISFFNSEGTVVFSNEPDKYYRYKIYQQIDFERLIRYRVANVTMHVQPFKYPLNESPISVSSLIWEGTDYDQAPYIFRAVSDSSIEVGNREIVEQITGGTVAWNQFVSSSATSVTITSGHKYVIYSGSAWSIGASTGSAITVSGSGGAKLFDLTQMFGTTIADYEYNQGSENCIAWFRGLFPNAMNAAYNPGELMSVKTSARETTGFNQWDEEWEVGSINASTGINGNDTSAIRSKNYIPVMQGAEYYFKTPSDKGNPRVRYYDSEKRFLSAPTVYRNAVFTVPSGARYIRFATQTTYGNTYNHDICINISKTTGSPKNGDYIPYEKHTYPLSNIELRGIPKLVNNKLVYDGDIYKADGSVTRRFGIVDLGTLTWSREAFSDIYFFRSSNLSLKALNYNFITSKYVVYVKNRAQLLDKECGLYNATSSANIITIRDDSYTDAASFKTAMSGVYLVYELASPTTETTTSYTETQICSPYGTEEFIDERDVQIPVGHKTKYAQIDPINIEITNSGNVPSMPTYRIEGSGSIDVNIDDLHAVTVDMSNINAITINSEEMNAYNDTGGFANRSVTGSYENLSLPVGNNTLEIDGDGVIDLLVTNYERWL